jgi:hypothetical protein
MRTRRPSLGPHFPHECKMIYLRNQFVWLLLCFISPIPSFRLVLIVNSGFGEVAETLPIDSFLLGRN